jgi:hypothetical protein
VTMLWLTITFHNRNQNQGHNHMYNHSHKFPLWYKRALGNNLGLLGECGVVLGVVWTSNTILMIWYMMIMKLQLRVWKCLLAPSLTNWKLCDLSYECGHEKSGILYFMCISHFGVVLWSFCRFLSPVLF